jgi:hypothetical protein
VLTIRTELTDRMLIFGECHLRRALACMPPTTTPGTTGACSASTPSGSPCPRAGLRRFGSVRIGLDIRQGSPACLWDAGIEVVSDPAAARVPPNGARTGVTVAARVRPPTGHPRWPGSGTMTAAVRRGRRPAPLRSVPPPEDP